MTRYQIAKWTCFSFAVMHVIASLASGNPAVAGSVWTAAFVVLYGMDPRHAN